MSTRLSVWSDVEAASGTRSASIPSIVRGAQQRRLDGGSRLVVEAPRDHAWLSSLTARQVIRAELESGDVFEWRVADIRDGRGAGPPVTVVTADPIALDCRDVGLIHDEESGGTTYYNLGGVDLTPTEYINAFVLPTFSAAGISWVALGTVDFTGLFTLAWERWTPAQLLNELAARTGGEWQLRRNGATNYLIDLVSEIGSAASQTFVADGRNLISLVRTRTRNDLVTVVVPTGSTPENGIERSNIGFAAWEVSAISGTDVTLADRAGGIGPIIEDDQYVGNYLLRPNGNLTQITDSVASTQTLTVGSVAGLACGDDVEIRKDSDGTLLTELSSVSGLASYDRVVGTYEMDERGERNHTPNPFAEDWATKPSGSYGQANGQQLVDSTILLKNVSPSTQVFLPGDVFFVMSDGAGDTGTRRITATATAAAGAVTLALSTAVSVDNNQVCYIHHGAGRAPDGWQDPFTAVVADAAAFHYRPTTEANLNGLVKGAHTSAYAVSCDGFTAGAEVRTGDKYSDGTNTAMVMIPSTADGSGNVTVYLNEAVTVSDNASVVITRPSFVATTFGQAVALVPRGNGVPTLDTPTYTVRHTPGHDTVWASVGLTMHSVAGATVATGQSLLAPVLELRDGSGVLASVQYEDATLTAGQAIDFTLRVAHTLTADTTLKIRVKGVEATDGTYVDGDPIVYVRWTQIHLGPDPDVPPIWGSHATKLWQDGLLRLQQHEAVATQYDATTRELVERWGLTPAEAHLQLGQTIRLKERDMGIDTTLRVVEITEDLVHPENTRVVLSTRVRPASQRIYDVAGGVAAGKGGGLVSTTIVPRRATNIEGTVAIEDFYPQGRPRSGAVSLLRDAGGSLVGRVGSSGGIHRAILRLHNASSAQSGSAAAIEFLNETEDGTQITGRIVSGTPQVGTGAWEGEIIFYVSDAPNGLRDMGRWQANGLLRAEYGAIFGETSLPSSVSDVTVRIKNNLVGATTNQGSMLHIGEDMDDDEGRCLQFHYDTQETSTAVGLAGELFATSTDPTSVICARLIGQANHTSGTVVDVHGVAGRAECGNTGDVTSLKGVQGLAINWSTGTVATAIAVHAQSAANLGGGTITTAVGLEVANQTTGTTNYAIRTGSGHVLLGGLPASDPAIAGVLWNDSGTVKISAG